MESNLDRQNKFVILVTGMKFESRLAKLFASRIKTIVSGCSPLQLENRIKEAIKDGGIGIISYGIAGALSPDIKSGTIIVGSKIFHNNHSFETDLKWRSHLKNILKRSEEDKVLGVDQPVITSIEKNNLYSKTKAVIVDMESHIAAKTAMAYGLPFVILRVVADQANRDLPDVVKVAIHKNGSINFRGIIFSLIRDPKQVGSLVTLGIDLYIALRTLFRCNRLLGEDFGFFDL